MGQPYEFGDNPAAADRARAIAPKLITAFDDIASAPRGLDVRTEHADVAHVLFGWWRYLTRTASVFYKVEGGLASGETAPLMRVMIEYVYSMAWLVDHGMVAMRALEEFDWKKRTDLVNGLRANGWPIADQLRVEDKPEFDFADEQEEKLHRTVLGEKNTFNNLVTAYGHPAMYDLYRLLCSYTHPSVQSAGLYLEAVEGGKLVLRDVPERHRDADVVWGVVVLIQAGKLMDRVLFGEPLRKVVGRAALDLGVPNEYFIVRPERPGRGSGSGRERGER